MNLENIKNTYATILGKETSFFCNEEMYLYDLDPGIYSADYIRAWIGRKQFVSYLELCFGLDWFSNRKAGKLLKKIWRKGFQKDIEGVLTDLDINKKHDYRNLVQKYKLLLGR